MGTVASRGRHQPHVHPHTANMGAKLSKKTELKEQTEDVQEAVADKSSTLPPPATEAESAIEKTQEEEEVVVTKAETLPRKAFDRSSNISKSFRKSMRKLVGKRKNKTSRQHSRRPELIFSKTWFLRRTELKKKRIIPRILKSKKLWRIRWKRRECP